MTKTNGFSIGDIIVGFKITPDGKVDYQEWLNSLHEDHLDFANEVAESAIERYGQHPINVYSIEKMAMYINTQSTVQSKRLRKKLRKNLSTPESRKFWEDVKKSANEVKKWPKWKREEMKFYLDYEEE